jgi:hypothetical protein
MGNGCLSTGEQHFNRIRITEGLLDNRRARVVILEVIAEGVRMVVS